jgi:hypothetical protein
VNPIKPKAKYFSLAEMQYQKRAYAVWLWQNDGWIFHTGYSTKKKAIEIAKSLSYFRETRVTQEGYVVPGSGLDPSKRAGSIFENDPGPAESVSDLGVGDNVKVRPHTSKPGKGLSYPAFTGKLLDYAGRSEGWDVVHVMGDDGIERSIYCFSIKRD